MNIKEVKKLNNLALKGTEEFNLSESGSIKLSRLLKKAYILGIEHFKKMIQDQNTDDIDRG